MVSEGTPHVGGPVDPPCSRDVLTNALGQARLGDLATCTGYALKDVIIEGAATILVNARYATRVKIKLWHGGAMTRGSPDVMFGGPTITAAEIIKKAKERAKQVLKCAKNRLDRWNAEDRAIADKWFGSDSDAVRDTLKERVANADSTIDEADFRLGPEDPDFADDEVLNDSGTFAHVDPTDTDHKVYLDTRFWSAPTSGTDNQTGALLHEMSHFVDVGDTDDVTRPEGVLPSGRTAYGQTNALWLADNAPDDALKNADNFEYFMEEVQETCK